MFNRRGDQPAAPEIAALANGAGHGANGAAPTSLHEGAIERLRKAGNVALRARIDPVSAQRLPRKELARIAGEIVVELLSRSKIDFNLLEQRNLVAALIGDLLSAPVAGAPAAAASAAPSQPFEMPASMPAPLVTPAIRDQIEEAKLKIQPILMERMDVSAASRLPREEFTRQVAELIAEILSELKIQLNLVEQRSLQAKIIDDMLGLGPLEPLLNDETINDIMVNGANKVYVERRGKLELTSVRFRDDAHVMNIATRIVTRIGRRVDESSPLVDARLEDGSRVNIIIPPLAIDGPSISIRKFSKKSITLDIMAAQNNVSPMMAKLLKIASRCRLNILISGGTGSGKTTLLNAMSQMIDPAERIVTIEDAAELQLQQPHVVQLGNPYRQPGRRRRDHDARSGQERAAYAPGPHHPGRGPRRRSGRHAAGHEHRP